MTVRAWLRSRLPTPPQRLAERIDEALGGRGDDDSTAATEHCVAAAEELLRDLLTRPFAGRESALDLLTVDALVTYAFEASATDPETLPRRADVAMTRLVAAVP